MPGLREILESMGTEMSGVGPSARLMKQIMGQANPKAGFGINMDTANWGADIINNLVGTAGPAMGMAGMTPKLSQAIQASPKVNQYLPKQMANEAGSVGNRSLKGLKVVNTEDSIMPTNDLLKIGGINREETQISMTDPHIRNMADRMKRYGYESNLLDSEPVILYKMPDGTTYIGDGNRRVRAADMAGVENIPVKIEYWSKSDKPIEPLFKLKANKIDATP